MLQVVLVLVLQLLLALLLLMLPLLRIQYVCDSGTVYVNTDFTACTISVLVVSHAQLVINLACKGDITHDISKLQS